MGFAIASGKGSLCLLMNNLGSCTIMRLAAYVDSIFAAGLRRWVEVSLNASSCAARPACLFRCLNRIVLSFLIIN